MDLVRLPAAACLALAAMLLGPPAPSAAADKDEEAEERVHQLRKEKRYKEALAFLDLAVKESPRSGNLRGIHCWIHLLDLKDPKTALDYALRLKQDLPEHRGGYYWSAKAYEALGHYGKCVETLQDFRPYGKDFLKDNLRASCHYKNGELEDALRALPDEEKLGGSFEKYEGWGSWLRGQIARRKLFEQEKERLRAQAAAPGARERAIALIKLGMLGVPDCVPLVDLAGAAGKGALKTVAANLKKEILAEPLFHKERKAPSVQDEAKRVRLPEAFAQIWKELDEKPGPGKIPAIAGKYMTKEMMESAKAYPSFAQPFVVKVNETSDKFSLGAVWIPVTGEIDTSFEPGRWYSIQHVKEGAVWTISAGLREKAVEFTSMSYRPNGKDLLLHVRNWTDGGDEFTFYEYDTNYIRVE